MPSPVNDHKKAAYASAVLLRVQQMRPILWETTLHDDISAEKKYWDVFGTATPVKRTSRLQPNQPQEVARTRRAVVEEEYEFTQQFDKKETREMMLAMEPTSRNIDAVQAGFAKKVDEVLIAAFDGTAFTGKEGGTATAFDSAQTLTVSAELSVNVLLQGFEVLENNYTVADAIQRGGRIWFVANPRHKRQLLKTSANSTIANVDYADVKALVDNKVDYFAGMYFRWHPGLAAGTAFIYSDDCMIQGANPNPIVKIDEMFNNGHGKQLATYLYTAASRLHEDKIVKLASITTTVA